MKTRTHTVKCNGKTLEPVEVYNPSNCEDLNKMVADKLETWASICAHYHNAKSVALQAARRREQVAKSVPKATFNRLYNAVPKDKLIELSTMENGWMHVQNHIAELWRLEMIRDAAGDSEPVVESEPSEVIEDETTDKDENWDETEVDES